MPPASIDLKRDDQQTKMASFSVRREEVENVLMLTIEVMKDVINWASVFKGYNTRLADS
jgi:hypothetical protein